MQYDILFLGFFVIDIRIALFLFLLVFIPSMMMMLIADESKIQSMGMHEYSTWRIVKVTDSSLGYCFFLSIGVVLVWSIMSSSFIFVNWDLTFEVFAYVIIIIAGFVSGNMTGYILKLRREENKKWNFDSHYT